MSTGTPFVILSAEREELGNVRNAERSELLFDRLTATGLSPVTVDGVYKSRPETSYLILLNEGDSGSRYAELCDLARLYDQDCILYVDAQRLAYFDDLKTGRPQLAGAWTELDSHGPIPNAYTVTPDGRCWSVVPMTAEA